MQANAPRAFRSVQGFGPALHSGFAGAIGRRAWRGHEGGNGCYHGDAPAQPIGARGLRGHHLQRRQRRIQHTSDIDLKNAAGLGGGFRGAARAGGNASIGNDQIKPPGARDPARHGRRIAYIQHTGLHFRPLGAAGGRGFFKPCGIAAGKMQHHARRGAGFRQGTAQAG